MADPNFDELNELDFDLFLEEMTVTPPPTEVAAKINPWRKFMNRVLWGVGLTTLTLNIWNLDLILPTIGMILLVLGFRGLRKENGWFGTGYVLSLVRMVWMLTVLFFNMGVFAEDSAISNLLAVGTYVMLIPSFLALVCLRNGIRSVQSRAGLDPHGGTGILIWYVILVVLAFFSYTGIAAWGLIIAYIFLIRGLYRLSGELDEAGYAIEATPVRFSDRTMKIAYCCIIVALAVVGYGFCGKYPMDWDVLEPTHSDAVKSVQEELIALGFPEDVLNDMTEEDILACDDAVCVLVQTVDYDMDQGRSIRTQEEIDSGMVAGITEEEGQRQLRTTFVGVQFADEREHWKIIHHFRWIDDTEFRGTEAIQMIPADHIDGWWSDRVFTGQVLYDWEGSAYVSDYYSLDYMSYQNDSMAAIMLGQSTSTELFATFSMPNDSENQRGYVAYDIWENTDGAIVDSWFTYIHQRSKLQFPVQTAKEFAMTSFFYGDSAFRRIQTAFQFYTHEEVPILLD